MADQDGSHHSRSSRWTFSGGRPDTGVVVGSRLPTVAVPSKAAAACTAPSSGAYLTSKNRLTEGRFGTMFKRLPAYSPPDDLLDDLARTMVEPDTSDVHLATSPRLFAGFTFIGQFIDHDITLDTTPLDQQLADPDATVNFRTARYDLDSVYGRGRRRILSSTIRPTRTSC